MSEGRTPFSPLDALARRLLDDVRRKAGIRHDRPLERKLARILAAMPLPVLEEWVAQIERAPADSPDWLSLIENLTIHETYFFRDLPHHAHLRGHLLPRLIADRRAARSLRLWSAGCATGEEAYSLAIVTLEALADAGEARRTGHGLETDWEVQVLGTDLSRIAVRQAANACYGGEGLGPFREMPDGYECWFVPLGSEAPLHRRVRADARRIVRFARHNLMDAGLPDSVPEGGFDLVSCRNVMIYFDDDSRDRALTLLTGAVAPGGWLVLGTTDRMGEDCRFERHRGDRALAYRRREIAP
ncbi:protein-glutamate O-methyltransferase CheR [Azospirillum sp. B21]|uniref:CheR family methyltransferase n=1 Tax=Azospirillum sp. B21 TaxID=2607496 RepID=UPI0011ED1095|nr:protein-glutamate O-methyltransferase CheR [Azospirillum sp. B21]KAA0583302.1 protein-glutamate O-methyltransferase CheR [Azospirillum sp. B21]